MHRLVVALVALIALTGAAVVAAYLFLFAAGADRAATLAPAETAVYANVYLQPSTGQQMNLSSLMGRLPGFADEATLDEKIDQIVQNLLGGSGIDYRADIKPWLGDQVALAAVPNADDPAQSDAIVIAEVKDPEAAREALPRLVAAGGDSVSTETYQGVELQVGETGAYAFVDEMLVIGSATTGVQAVVDTSAGAESLADRGEFRDAMADLPADHLASIFVDLAALAETTGVEGQLGVASTASAVLVAEDDGLRLSGSAPLEPAAGASASAVPAIDDPSTLVEWMPADTIAEVVVFGLRRTLEDAEAAAGTTPEGQDLASALDTVRAIAAFGLGIDLDADLLPLLDREVALAIGGFDGTLPSGQLLLRPDDPEAAAAALDRVADRLREAGGSREEREVDGTAVTVVTVPEVGEVAYATVDDVIILALSADDVAAAARANAGGQSLAGSDAYRRTFDLAGARGGTEIYLDIGALFEALGDGVELPSDARDILLQIGSLGVTAPSRVDHIEFHAALTIDEP